MSKAQEIGFYQSPNSDDDLRAIQPGWFRYAKHLRTGTISSQGQFARETYEGNALLVNAGMPAGTNRVLGMCTNVEGKSIIYFVFNSNNNHTIWSLDTNTSTFTKVVQSSFLAFQITDYIYHAFVNNGILYWTVGRFTSFINDNYSEPKQVDISQAILLSAGQPSAYTAFTRRTFDFVKWPQVTGPTATYATDTNQSANFLYGKFYKYRVEYIYLNNEVSATSPVSRLPLPVYSDYVTGRDYINTQADNIVNVVVNTGPDIVTKFNLLVSVNDGPWFVYDQVNKSLQGLSNNATYTSIFRGNEALIPRGFVLRNYDNVPLTAFCEAMLPSRQIAFGNYREGFDKIALNATAQAIPVELTGRKPFVCGVTYTLVGGNTNLSISSGPQAVNVQEGDVYVFPVYIDATYPENTVISYTITRADYDAIQLSGTPNIELLTILGDFISLTFGVMGAIVGAAYQWTGEPNVFVAPSPTAFNTYRRTDPKPGLFKGIQHEFGIQYYDRANRDGTVLTTSGLKIYVPFDTEQSKVDFQDPNNPFYTIGRILISSIPPEFATHYQIVWRRVPVPAQQERTMIMFQDDGVSDMFKISLDNNYPLILGGKYNQNIQVGDQVRFIRQQSTAGVSPTSIGAYSPQYAETEVLRYDPVGGLSGSEAIWISKQFDPGTILGTTTIYGAVIQIYTPGKLDENAPWREIGEEYPVLNPNTANRLHGGSAVVGTATDLATGLNTFSLASWLVGPNGGNFEYLVGRTFTITADVLYTGTITAAVFNPATHITTITASTNFTGAQTFGTVLIGLSQTLTLPAINNLVFGDIYTLIRRMSVGSGQAPKYFTVDDFYYSGFYVSNFNSVGRLAIEKNDARQILQKATIEHGGSYIDNSEVNNLCLFDASVLENVLAMDEQYGPINKMVMMDGYTLKCIQDMKENSAYITSTFGVIPIGAESVAGFDSSKTFANWRPMGEQCGTLHPLSARVIKNRLYYYDHINGTVIRSDGNGPDDICEGKYKQKKRINDFKIGVDTIGLANAWVSSLADEQNNEYQLTLFNTAATTVGIQGLVFRYDRDMWDHDVSYAVFFAMNLGNYLISSPALAATVWRHGTGAQNSFYGTIYASDLSFPWNIDPALLKRPLRIGLRTNMPWTMVSFVTEVNESYPVQDTEVASTQWRLLEGYYWADFLNDKNNVVPEIPSLATTQLALINGREIRAYGATGLLRYTPSTGVKAKIWSATILSEESDPPI